MLWISSTMNINTLLECLNPEKNVELLRLMLPACKRGTPNTHSVHTCWEKIVVTETKYLFSLVCKDVFFSYKARQTWFNLCLSWQVVCSVSPLPQSENEGEAILADIQSATKCILSSVNIVWFTLPWWWFLSKQQQKVSDFTKNRFQALVKT